MNIALTDNAIAELKNLNISREEFLRISLVPGGCSGLSYQMESDSTLGEQDTVLFENDDLRVVSHQEFVQYLNGLNLDYSDDLIDVGFRFNNPNAVKTCGCGNSMEVE